MEYRDSSSLKPKFETTTGLSAADITKVRTKINWTLQKAKDVGYDLSGMPAIHIKPSLKGRTAGYAKRDKRTGEYLMLVHPRLMQKYGDAYFDRTVPHEVAHLIVSYKYPGSQAHGFEWHKVMRDLGQPDTRCHSYDTSDFTQRMARPYIYACRCREHKLTHILHNRIQQGRWRKCKDCRQRVEFIRVA